MLTLVTGQMVFLGKRPLGRTPEGLGGCCPSPEQQGHGQASHTFLLGLSPHTCSLLLLKRQGIQETMQGGQLPGSSLNSKPGYVHNLKHTVAYLEE